MRTQLIVGGFLSFCAAAAVAAEESAARPDPRPRSHIQPVAEVAAAASATWTGFTTSRAPIVLRQQLALERGAGLIVEEVVAGSLADKAGLRLNDVLVSLDGQLLVVPEQFTTLLAESGDDAPLTCKLVRGGKETVVSLRPPLVGASPSTSARFGGGRGPLKPAASTLAMLPSKSVPPAASTNRPRKAALSGTVVQMPDGSLLQHDPDYSIRLTVGSDTKLIVKDARGWVVFNDAIDTPEQRSLVPVAVRSRVEGLEKLAGFAEPTERPVVAERSASPPPTARIGTLDIAPIKVH